MCSQESYFTFRGTEHQVRCVQGVGGGSFDPRRVKTGLFRFQGLCRNLPETRLLSTPVYGRTLDVLDTPSLFPVDRQDRRQLGRGDTLQSKEVFPRCSNFVPGNRCFLIMDFRWKKTSIVSRSGNHLSLEQPEWRSNNVSLLLNPILRDNLFLDGYRKIWDLKSLGHKL